MTLEIDTIDEKTIGGMIILFSIITTLTGEAAGINPFGQPGVDDGKRIAKSILKKVYKSSSS